jgi:hypothetical protein
MHKSTAIDHEDPNIRAKLRRHLKDRQRRERDAPGPLQTGAQQQASQSPILSRMYARALDDSNYGLLTVLSLSEWNSPFGPLASSIRLRSHAQQVSTPPDLIYHTPPFSGDSPRDEPSPLTVEIQRNSAQRNARLLVQGKFDDLLTSLNKNEIKYVIQKSVAS